MNLPAEQDAAEAIYALGQSDQAYARAYAATTAAKENLKIEKAAATPDEGTVQQKEKAALTSPQYREALDRLTECEYDKKLLELERERHHMTFEFWRSLEASRRRT